MSPQTYCMSAMNASMTTKLKRLEKLKWRIKKPARKYKTLVTNLISSPHSSQNRLRQLRKCNKKSRSWNNRRLMQRPPSRIIRGNVWLRLKRKVWAYVSRVTRNLKARQRTKFRRIGKLCNQSLIICRWKEGLQRFWEWEIEKKQQQDRVPTQKEAK